MKKIRLGGRAVGSNGGFSLIEMLVAMGIFMIFTGVIISSYVGIVKALRGAEEYRVLYAESRHVFDVVTDVARNSTIYTSGDVVCNEVGFMANEMEFCYKDGLKRVRFYYDDGKLNMNEEVRPNLNQDFSAPDGVEFYSDEVRVTNFNFYVWPKKNPFSYDQANLANLFHPKVTFVATFEKDNPKGGVYELDLQTSVSLRTYN